VYVYFYNIYFINTQEDIRSDLTSVQFVQRISSRIETKIESVQSW